MAEISCSPSTKIQILLGDSTGGSSIRKIMEAHGYDVAVGNVTHPASAHVRTILPHFDVILLDVTTASHDVLKTIEQLSPRLIFGNTVSRLLCFSTAHRNPDFVLRIQRCGARYARVSDAQMLVEALDLLVAELRHLQRHGPSFVISHRFAQDNFCVPGEEISAVELACDGNTFQLHLALAQRFVFDYLAHHRRIALDSLQIVSGLTGDWFYRDHAANSEHPQPKKILRPTVRVIVQRIRDAMEVAFAKAQVKLDPHDVLRSCPAEGSKRVLYKLCADVRWHHTSR